MLEQDVHENKVTVAFKCAPSLKTQLSKDSQQLGISLSEYSESIISNHYSSEKPNPKPETKTDQSSEERMKNLIEQNESLNKELAAIIDNEGLHNLFKEYKDKNLEYKNQKGEVKKIKVLTYSDVITALIETVVDKK